MYIIGNFIASLANVVSILLTLTTWLIFVRAMISWVNPDPHNPIVQFLYKSTEPILEPIRRLIPTGRIDLSPIIALVLIIFLQGFIVASLKDIGYQLRQKSMKGSPITVEFEREPYQEQEREDFLE